MRYIRAINNFFVRGKILRSTLAFYLASYLAFTPFASAATVDWNFSSSDDSTLSNSTNVGISGGVASLTALDFTDNANDATGFSGGTQSNTQWDAGNSWVELTDPTVNATGDFTSRILNAGASVPWNGTIAWTPTRPALKELPNSAGVESGYTSGNIDMTGNKLLLHLNDTNWTDDSGNSNAMTGNGGVGTTSSGQFNSAASLDGTDDYLSRTYDADFDFGTGGFSASGWFKSSGSSATTSVTSRVTTSTDDAEQNLSTGAVSVTSSDLELVYDGVDQQVGMRFPGVNVPAGASIDSAKITFTGDSTQSGNVTLTFSGQAVDSAPSFIAKASEISNRTKTAASVNWINPASWALNQTYDTPDLKTIIQEIVNQAGWVSGNAMALFVDSADTAAKRKAFSYDGENPVGEPTKTPLLTIVYKQPQILLSRYDGDQGFKVWLTSAGKIAFAIDDDAVWTPDCQVSTSGSTTYNDNTWHHFAVVKTANTDLTLYVDGTSVATIGTVTSGCTGSVTREIITSTDDAEQTVSNGAMDLVSSDLDIYTTNECAVRFQNLPIPQGATITSATIDLKVQTTTSNSSTTLTLKSELADNAGTFTSTASNISGRTHSTSPVSWVTGAWNTAGATVTSPDIKAIVQDVVDRGKDADHPGNWASGNSLVIFITSDSGTLRSVEGHDNDDNTLDAASITINYKHPAQGTLTSDSAALRLGSDTPTTQNYFSGTADEIALFNRALSATEVANLYKRGAIRLRFQVRSCNDNACSGETFIGPDGTSATYYEEQDSNTIGLPSLTLTNVSNNQWFQYKTFFETSDTSITPELKSVVLGPTHYDAGDPTVINNTAQSYSSLSGFAATLGVGNAGTVKYQVSSDGGTNWKWYTGGAWTTTTAGYADSNTAAEINTNIGTLGGNSFKFKAFLHSANGTEAVELDNINLTYTLSSNASPTSAAGTDATVADVATISLSGTCTDSDTGDTLTGTWSQVSGTSCGTISGTPDSGTGGSLTAAASCTAPDVAANSNLTFRLTCNDGTVSATDDKVVTVNAAPTANAGTDQSVNDSVNQVNLSCSSSSDPNNESLTYSWTETADPQVVCAISGSSTSATATINVTNKTVSSTCTYRCTVNDGTQNAQDTVDVIISGDNDAPSATGQSLSTNEDTATNITLSGTDPEGNTLTFSTTGCATPSKGALSGLNTSTGAITYTPNSNETGSDSFTFKVGDGTSDSSCATISITIATANDAPTAANTTVATNEDTDHTFASSQFNFSDVDTGDTLNKIQITTLESAGALKLAGNDISLNQEITTANIGSITFTPAGNANGAAYTTFQFKVSDGTTYSSSAYTMTINVTAVNDTPTANAQSVSATEDTAKNITLTGSDVDTSDTLSFSTSGCTSPSKGTLSSLNSSSGAITYTPNANANGSDAFGFKVNDGTIDSSCATVSVSITAVNDAPVLASIGNKSVAENSALSFTISATDADGDAITYSATSLPSGASFNTSTATFSWTPDYSQSGSYTPTFTTSDGTTDDSEQITITVNNTDRAPILASIGNKSVAENSTLSFTLSASDADGDVIVYSMQNGPSGAELSGANFSWTPSYSQSGSYNVTLKASSGNPTLEASETITISVSNTNRSPVLSSIGNKSVAENAALSFTASATDADGDSLSWSCTNANALATTKNVCQYFNTSTRAFAWTPDYTSSGSYQMTIAVSDNAVTAGETITITVSNTNRAPVISPVGNKEVAENSELDFTVTVTDPDNDTVTLGFASSQGEVLGTACESLSGASITQVNASSFRIRWTPGYSLSGFHCTTLQATDNVTPPQSSTLQIIISVSNTNRLPVIADIANQTIATPNTLTLAVSATDPDGDTVTLSMSSAASGNYKQLPSTATFNASTKTLTWATRNGDGGSYVATFTAADNGTPALSATKTVYITVNQTNQTPTLSVTTEPNADNNKFICQKLRDLVTINVTGSDADTADTLTYAMTGRPANASFATGTGSNKVFSWAPSAEGTTTLTFTVTDPRGASASSSYTIVAVTSLDRCTAAIATAQQTGGQGGGTSTEPSTPSGPPVAKTCFGNLTETDGVCVTTRIVRSQTTVQLDGRSSYQPALTASSVATQSSDGLMYHWTQVAGGGCTAVDLSDNNSTTAAEPSFTAPKVPADSTMQCKFDLIVENSFGVSAVADRATVRVVANTSDENAIFVPYHIYGQVTDGIVIHDPPISADSNASIILNTLGGLSAAESQSAASTLISIIDPKGAVTNLKDFAKVDRKFSLLLPVTTLHTYDIDIMEAKTGAAGATQFVISLPMYDNKRGAIFKFNRDGVLADAAASTGGLVVDLLNGSSGKIDHFYGETPGEFLGADLKISDFDEDGVSDLIFKRRDVSADTGYLVGLTGGNYFGNHVTLNSNSFAFAIGGQGVNLHEITIVNQKDAHSDQSQGYSHGPRIGVSILGQQTLTIDLRSDIRNATQSNFTFQGLGDALVENGRAVAAGGFNNFVPISIDPVESGDDGSTGGTSGGETTGGTGGSGTGGTTGGSTTGGTTTSCPPGYVPPPGYSTTSCGSGGGTTPYVQSLKAMTGQKASSSQSETVDTAETTNVGTGDVNNDGYSDTVVGDATAANVYVFYGTATTTGARDTTTADITISCMSVSDNCGSTVIVGDLSGDSYADIIIGAPEAGGEFDDLAHAGEIYIIYGGVGLDKTMDVASYAGMNIIYGSSEGGYLGTEMVIIDADKNGVNELACNLRSGGAIIISFDVLKALGRSLRVDQLGLETTTLDNPTRVVMLKLNLVASVDEALAVNSLTLTAAGSGLDDHDIKSVLLFEDVNADGKLDGNDRQIGKAQTYTLDDGTLTLKDLGESIAAGKSVQWLVIYDFDKDSTSSGLSLVPKANGFNDALIPLILLMTALGLLWVRCRKRLSPRGVMIFLFCIALFSGVNCGHDDGLGITSRGNATYQVKIAASSDVGAVGVSSGENADILGAPLSGTEVTVTNTETNLAGGGGSGGCGGTFDRLSK